VRLITTIRIVREYGIIIWPSSQQVPNKKEIMAFLQLFEKRMMPMLDAYHKSIMAWLQQTEANTEKIEQDPGRMQSVEEHQDVPREETAIAPVTGLKKRRRVSSLTAERRQKK
jgi:hypothetical protein